jgi:hypothetical protein
MVTAAMRSAARIALLLAGACAAHAAAAATIDFDVNAAVGRTDNIARVPDGEQDATIRSVGLQLAVLHDARRLDADVVGDFTWMDYSGDVFSSELTGSGAGRLSLDFVPERLRWVVEDSFGQTRRDLFSVPTPLNRENVNYFATGPDLQFRLGASTSLLLGGRYARVDFEDSPADSQRMGGWLGAERTLSGAARLSLNTSVERIEPRNEVLVPSYDRTAAFLGYAVSGARTSISVNLGANRVRGGGLDESGALAQIEVGRDAGRRSRMTLRIGHELTDSGSVMGQQSSGELPMPGGGTDAMVQAAQPFTHNYAELSLLLNGRRTSVGFSGGWFDEDYVGGNAADRQRWALGANLSRVLTSRARVSAGLVYNASNFEAASTDNDDLSYNLALSVNLGRRLGIEVSGERYAFSSDLPSSDLDETRYWLRLRFGGGVDRTLSPR